MTEQSHNNMLYVIKWYLDFQSLSSKELGSRQLEQRLEVYVT
jgi:hypothetical protein